MKIFLLASCFQRRSRLTRGGLLALLLLLSGCDSTDAEEDIFPADHWFLLSINETEIKAQLAVTLSEMRRGLMHREELEKDAGMLFIYQRPQGMNFYMRNTPIPLDIGFFSPDGQLRERYAMYPFDETPVLSQSNNLQFALEMNQSWFSKNAIHSGARLDLGKVRDALRKRGFDPAEFGL